MKNKKASLQGERIIIIELCARARSEDYVRINFVVFFFLYSRIHVKVTQKKKRLEFNVMNEKKMSLE